MAVQVAKAELKNVSDASGLEEQITSGKMQADQIVAVIGKTEGNGGVNDFTRILADQAFRALVDGNDGGSRAPAFGVRDYGRLTAFENGHTGVRGSEIDADDLAHWFPLSEAS